MEKGKLYLGTSGFAYDHWRDGIFYPPNLPKKKELSYYSRQFNSIEINYSFYRSPSLKTFLHWKLSTKDNFIFSLKVPRHITHFKRLKGVKKIWQEFLKRAMALEEKLGPFLFQFPSNWKKNEKRLKELIKILEEGNNEIRKVKYAFEFRHQSWFEKDIYNILNKENFSICLTNSPYWPFSWQEQLKLKNKFLYIRMHGPKELYSSNYSHKELKLLTEKIEKWREKGLNIYLYFNNDAYGFAPENAKKILKLIDKK